ncbi:MAG: AsmA family protein [Rhodospirillales bacterium]
MRRLWKILSIVTVVTIAVAVSGIVVLQTIDFSRYKSVLIEEVEKATGRKLAIDGEFKLDVGFDAVLAVENVRFSNASWGSRPEMIKLERMKIDLKVLPLLFSDIQVERLILVGLDALLETDSKGRGNWELETAKPGDASASSASMIPVIQEIDIQNLNVTYRDGVSGKTTKASVGELVLFGKDKQSPLDFRFAARYDGLAYRASGTLGSVDTLLNGGRPYAVDVDGRAAGLFVKLKGSIASPRDLKGLNLDFTATGKNLAESFKTISARIPGLQDIEAPPVEGFRIAGRLTGSPDRLGLAGLDVSLGDTGKLSVNVKGTVTDVIALQGLNVQVAASGDEVADTVNLARAYVPSLRDISLSPLGPYALSARLQGSLKALAVSDIDVSVGKASTLLATAKGRMADAIGFKGVDVRLTLEGKTLEPLEAIAGTALPKFPPFNVRLHTHHQKDKLIKELEARIGVSDLKGRVDVKLGGAKPAINGQLTSERIDLDELFPPSPAPPPPQARDRAGKPARLFSGEPFSLGPLRAVNVQAGLKIDRLKYRGNVIEKVEGGAALQDGKLTVDHLFATVAEGRFVSKLTFDASTDRPVLAAQTDIRELPLGGLLKKADITDTIRLTVDAEMKLDGQGGSPHALAAGLKGHARVVGRDGYIDSRFLAGAVSGVTDIIPWFRHEDANKINCFVTRFDVDKGVAKSKVMLLDSPGMVVKGRGTVDLGKETLDMTFVPKAKKTSLASFALPMTFKGPITAPRASTNVSKEAIETVTNVVTTVGSVLLGPVGLLGSLGLNAVTGGKKVDACVDAMKSYSGSMKAPVKSSGAPPPAPADPAPKKDQGTLGTITKGVGRTGEAAGEVVKGVGNAIKGLFGGEKK